MFIQLVFGGIRVLGGAGKFEGFHWQKLLALYCDRPVVELSLEDVMGILDGRDWPLKVTS